MKRYVAYAAALGAAAILAASPLAGSSRPGDPAALARGADRDQDPPVTFRAGADLVSVEASVRRQRRAVAGLTAADFEILDNGVPQEISSVTYEKLPIDVTVVLDVSASVTGRLLDRLRRSVQQLRADLGARDRLKLMTFNMRIRRLADFGEPAAGADAAFRSVTGYGSSAIFDALAVALTATVPPGRRQLIVLFSDGQDSSSISDPEVLLEVARRSTPTVAVVLASDVPQRSASMLVRPSTMGIAIGDLYSRIASETGGVVVATAADDSLAATFRRVLDEFRTSYVLYFAPRGVERAGAHTLDVRVKQAGADVRARRGYVWR